LSDADTPAFPPAMIIRIGDQLELPAQQRYAPGPWSLASTVAADGDGGQGQQP
jgi:hypothetical protein